MTPLFPLTFFPLFDFFWLAYKNRLPKFLFSSFLDVLRGGFLVNDGGGGGQTGGRMSKERGGEFKSDSYRPLTGVLRLLIGESRVLYGHGVPKYAMQAPNALERSTKDLQGPMNPKNFRLRRCFLGGSAPHKSQSPKIFACGAVSWGAPPHTHPGAPKIFACTRSPKNFRLRRCFLGGFAPHTPRFYRAFFFGELP